MKALVKQAPEPGFEYVEDWAEPTPASSELLVEVAAASICGTDREIHEWSDSARAFQMRTPVVAGHEAAGTIVEVGSQVHGWRVGDRVAFESHLACGRCLPCRTGSAHICEHTLLLGMHLDGVFAERVAVPQSICYRLPDSVSLEAGALLEPAGVAMHAIQRAGYSVAGQRVIVNGAGPVGLAIALLARHLGAVDLIVVEPNGFRRGQAESLGLAAIAPSEDVQDYCRQRSGRRNGFDVAFEVSGVPATIRALLPCLRAEGELITVGHPGAPASIDIATHINKRGITLRGIYGRRIWDTWEAIGLLVEVGGLNLLELVTHRFPLRDAEQAIGLLRGEAGKILLFPQH